jgi:uncharacterized membrane protein YbhN (UPF0104 family)
MQAYYFYPMLKNKNIKIMVKTIIGVMLFFWMAYSIFHQVSRQPNLTHTLRQMLTEWNSTKVVLMALVFVFMILNWTIEAAKWRMLIRGTENFSLWKSLQSVLTGVAVSIITPNRVGEYMGRILYLKNANKIKGITVTIVGSFAQLIVTGFLGLLGLSYYIIHIKSSLWLYVLLLSSVFLSIILTYVYFNLQLIVALATRYIFLKKIKTYLAIINRFGRKQLIKILMYSLGRYLVYTLQFFMLLQILLVRANPFDLIFTIWLIFWAMAIVPTIAIAEVGIRGETALFFLLPISANQLGIISSTMLLWLINLIIPALVGCLFIYKMKIYEDE